MLTFTILRRRTEKPTARSKAFFRRVPSFVCVHYRTSRSSRDPVRAYLLQCWMRFPPAGITLWGRDSGGRDLLESIFARKPHLGGKSDRASVTIILCLQYCICIEQAVFFRFNCFVKKNHAYFLSLSWHGSRCRVNLLVSCEDVAVLATGVEAKCRPTPAWDYSSRGIRPRIKRLWIRCGRLFSPSRLPSVGLPHTRGDRACLTGSLPLKVFLKVFRCVLADG